jgi:hypothetical protein
MMKSKMRIPSLLLLLVSVYCAASLAHFWHNAEYLADYPNLPVWLARGQIYATWFGIAALGALGLFLLWAGRQIAGLSLLAVYAGVGFDGLAHYRLAPMASHTFATNLTIWSEVVAATLLLSFVIWQIHSAIRQRA